MADYFQYAQQQPQSPPPKQGGFNLGGLLSSILSPIVNAGITTTQNVAGGGFELGRAALQPILGDKVYVDPKTNKPVDNPFQTPEKLSDPKNILDQAKASAELASFAVPFGGEASLFGKTLPGAASTGIPGFLARNAVPGAIAGGLQGVAEKNATPESVINSALGGAAGASALQGILNGAGVVGKLGNKVEEAGANIRQGATPIELKPSVYGAANERGVQKTLNDLGITGSAQAKYEKLQPAMGQLGDKIRNELESNPTSVPISQIKQDFMTNLQDKLRTKDLTAPQAQKEIDGYLRDLSNSASTDLKRVPLTKGGSTQIFNNDQAATTDLFDLKKLVNKDYQNVAKKISNGTALNPREKVVAAARQTLDDVISNAHPLVKEATTQQSHLYDAAESLAKSRSNPAGAEILGTKIPGRAVQSGTDMLGNILQKAGGIAETGNNVTQAVSNPALQAILGQVGARTGANLNDIANQPQNSEQGVDNNYEGNNVQSNGNQDTQNVTQQPQSVNPYPIENYIADATRDPKNAAFYKQVYDAYQAQDAATQKAQDDYLKSDQYKSAQQGQQTKQAFESLLDQFKTIPESQIGPLGGAVAQTPLLGQLLAPAANEYEQGRSALAAQLKDIVGAGAGSGVRVSDAEIKAWTKLLPSIQKTPEQNSIAIKKLNSLIQNRFGVGLDSQYLK